MDPRVDRLAKLLVEYSCQIEPGDRVFIEGETEAEPLIRALFHWILQAGGYPFLLLSFSGIELMSGLDDVFMKDASEHQIEFPATFHQLAYEDFESRIRIHSQSNTKALTNIPSERIARRRKALGSILATQFRRGQNGDLKWVTTLFPTQAYAQEADMSLPDFESYVYGACGVETEEEPVARWLAREKEQSKIVDALKGADQVEVKSPNCALKLSVRGRIFKNACGRNNMPDGEVFTGPVEDSVEGWVRFTYPAIYQSRVVSGVELHFEQGKVVQATAEKGQDLLLRVLDTDAGSRYLGEFAIGNNHGIDRFIGNILFDEKIGGSFHMALGAGYPDTGSVNQSAIHWDMICDLRRESEILVDGIVFYKDGAFVL